MPYAQNCMFTHCKERTVRVWSAPDFQTTGSLFSVLRNDNAPRAPSTLPARHVPDGVELAVELELLLQQPVGKLRTIWRVYDNYL